MIRSTALLLAAVIALSPNGHAQHSRETTDAADALIILGTVPMSAEYVEVYLELHRRAWTHGDRPTAHSAIERVVTWWEQEHADAPDRLADRLARLTDQLLALGDYGEALSVGTAALAAQESIHGTDAPELMGYLGAITSAYDGLAEYATARRVAERSVEIAEAALAADHPQLAYAISNLAMMHVTLGDYTAARPLLLRALDILEAALGPTHLDLGALLQNLASLDFNTGRLAEAQHHSERALAITKVHLDAGSPELATGLGNLGLILLTRGQADAALEMLTQALEISEAAFGPNHELVIDSLNKVGMALTQLGESAAARNMYERALEAAERTAGPTHPILVPILNNLGNQLIDIGAYREGLSALERALAIQESTFEPDHPMIAVSLRTLAGTLANLEQLAEARPLYERCLAIFEGALDPGHSEIAATLHGLSVIERKSGNHAAALAHGMRALSIMESSVGSAGDVSSCLRDLALLHRDAGHHEAAYSFAERALSAAIEFYGEAHFEVEACRSTLALIALHVGDPDAALAYSMGSVPWSQLVQRKLFSLPAGAGHRFLGTIRWARDTALTAAEAATDPVAQYETVLQAKGQIARLTLQTREQIRASTSQDTLDAWANLTRLDEALATLHRLQSTGAQTTTAAELRALRNERDVTERAVRAQLSTPRVSATPVATIAGSLPPDAMAVDILVHRMYEGHLAPNQLAAPRVDWSDNQASAWLVRPDSVSVQRIALGSAEAIDEAVDALLAALLKDNRLNRRGLTSLGPDEQLEAANDRLRKLIWEPLRPHLENAKTIILSPDGPLARVPYAVIKDAAGRYLIERFTFLDPGEMSAVAQRDAHDLKSLDAGVSLLVVGGVDYDQAPRQTDSEDSALVTRSWRYLPATQREADGIMRLHARHVAEEHPRMLLEGAQATEQTLKTEAPRHQVLHLATHGYFDSEAPPNTFLPGESFSFEDGALPLQEISNLHPGLLCGVVLAGANSSEAHAGASHDGYLTATEVIDLDLSDVELVVLSACETGMGLSRSGEGMHGLRRGFHMAGARTVVSSLWSVEDESTSELMLAFYENLLVRGLGRGDALRQAQLDMLARNRAEGDPRPETWGAFVLSGEWR